MCGRWRYRRRGREGGRVDLSSLRIPSPLEGEGRVGGETSTDHPSIDFNQGIRMDFSD